MLESSYVSHLIHARATPGFDKALGERLATLVLPTRRAKGCVRFSLQRSLTEPALWVLAGTWRNAEAMQAWFTVEQAQLFNQLVSERLVASLDFNTFADVEPAYRQLAADEPWWLKVG